MSIYAYEPYFQAQDRTGKAMRRSIADWFELYYQRKPQPQLDSCQRVAYTVVNKLTRGVFSEYSAQGSDRFAQEVLRSLDGCSREAVQLALVGGESYLKPWPKGKSFGFTVIPRNHVLIFARDHQGRPTDVGTVERSVGDKYFYTLLERRRLDEKGYLTVENKLMRSLNEENPGQEVSLQSHPMYADLPKRYTYRLPVGSVGLVQLKTPILNCVDGSADGVSVYAAAAELIRNIDRNEALLCQEFEHGQSRVLASSDLLDKGQLKDSLFVALDEDAQTVGITVYSPQLREESFLRRKQEYLRNVETIVGLKRGLLSDANMDERTATEIAASQAEHNLAIMDFQRMWERSAREALRLCSLLAELYGMGQRKDAKAQFDWGNGILYDEEKTWNDYKELVDKGLLRPEIALGWRFGMETGCEADLQKIREKYMPQSTDPSLCSE